MFNFDIFICFIILSFEKNEIPISAQAAAGVGLGPLTMGWGIQKPGTRLTTNIGWEALGSFGLGAIGRRVVG